MSNVYPRTFSHIGISVPDLDAAVTFYTEVLGWYLIMEPTDIEEDDSAINAGIMSVLSAQREESEAAAEEEASDYALDAEDEAEEA